MNRKEKLKQLFKHNTVLKISSIGIAFLIWLAVVNISDPEVTETVTSEISVLYEDELTGKNKTYTLDTKTVKISYKIRSSYRRQVHQSDFNTYVDLRDLSITGAVPVYVEVSNNAKTYISNNTVSPIVVHVDTEDMIEKSFGIETKITGSPAEGKVAGSVSLSSDSITLFGPASEISKIAGAEIDISVDGALTDVGGTAVPVFYDTLGNTLSLSDKTILKNSIDYTAVIYTKKNIPVNVSANGSPADGYKLDSVSVTPSYVVIYGTDDAVAGCDSILIPSSVIDINGADKNVTVSLNISQYVPQNVYMDGTGETAVVAAISRENNSTEETSVQESSASESIAASTLAGEAEISESITETENAPSEPERNHETAETRDETRPHIVETRPREGESSISELPNEETRDTSLH